MSATYYYIEPIDVVMVRGNRSFGEAGEHGEAVLPPWPSLFAGAFRTALLAQDAAQLARFGAGQRLEGPIGACLGTPDEPGPFRVTWVSLAKRDGRALSAAVPLPADLARFRDGDCDSLVALQPAALPHVLRGRTSLPMQALLRARQAKPVGGWLDQNSLASHLAGSMPQRAMDESDLYRRELRLGIALDGSSRTAAESALYTTEAVAFSADTGFLVGIEGTGDLIPSNGYLRLGGDARAARYERVDRVTWSPPAVPLERIDVTKRFRLVLATAAIFSQGWLPDNVHRDHQGEYRLEGCGFNARLACATILRYEVVSGWDLAKQRPKTAQRVVPAGSVYWFDQLQGDVRKLAHWVGEGIWIDNGNNTPRRAEGFNLAWLGAWY